jgi:hypothetical protein
MLTYIHNQTPESTPEPDDQKLPQLGINIQHGQTRRAGQPSMQVYHIGQTLILLA